MTITTIALTLVNKNTNIDPLEIVIQLNDNKCVKKWYNRFKYELESNAFLKKEHIFMGQSSLTVKQMIDQINNTLDGIADWDFVLNQHPDYPVIQQPDISIRLKEEDFVGGNDNKLMNTVHNYFPMLAGTATKTNNYMYAASPKVRALICRLNLEIHELHTMLQNNNNKGCHINISWQRAPKNLEHLTDNFNDIFDKQVMFGDVLLGYPQVGKTHFEAFIEEDEELDDENVEPIFLLSGDMLLHLSGNIGAETINSFDRWLIDKGLDPNDKKMRYGFAKLGRVINIDVETAKDITKKYNDINKITINDEGGTRSFTYNYNRYDSDYDDLWVRHVDD